MALSNLTKVQTVGIGSNIEVVGVITTGQFKSGTSNLHSTGIELTNLNVSGIATIGGNVTIGGVLTYQDVTNVDSLGIGTFRTGINVSGGQLDVGSNIKLGNAGVITATSFVGSGANLTGITQVGGGNSVTFNDSVAANFGTGNDLRIYHDGSESVIGNNTGTFQFLSPNEIRYRATTHHFLSYGNDETMAKFIDDGAVEIYHDNVKKFDTITTGIRVHGDEGGTAQLQLLADQGDDDADYWRFIAETNGILNIQDYGAGSWYNNVRLTGNTGGVQLFHGNSLKFSTTTHGIVVEDDTPYIVIKDNDTNSGTAILGWIEAQRSDGSAMWKIGNTHNDQNTLWINQTQNASTKFTGAVSGDTWEIYGNSGHFTPCSDNTFDIGESNRRIRNIYTADLHCSNRGSSNDVDGTWGDYTIQEGESDLFLINNRSGKKYKFNLTEVN